MKKINSISSQNNLKVYLDEVKNNSLLSADEEIELAKRIPIKIKSLYIKW